MIQLGEYTMMKRQMVQLDPNADFDTRKGQVNPKVTEYFLDKYGAKISLIWEPFGWIEHNQLIDLCEHRRKVVISYCLGSADKRSIVADSTKIAPHPLPVDAVIFHPPYFGSTAFTTDSQDLSNMTSWKQYMANITACAELAVASLAPSGLVCVVGRSYPKDGEKIRLDWHFANVFLGLNMELVEVYGSLPDVAMVLRKK